MRESPIEETLKNIGESLERIADNVAVMSLLTSVPSQATRFDSDEDFQEWLKRATRAHKELMSVLRDMNQTKE